MRKPIRIVTFGIDLAKDVFVRPASHLYMWAKDAAGYIGVLAIELHELRLEVRARWQDIAYVIQNLFCEHSVTVFRHEGQMDLDTKSALAAPKLCG
ncbi:hypothetical protein LMG29542_07701 [Paraburkholderia humisilvae]|uniref:Uncharacterized protein n=1 Tax=Paraburkholderia humisilvae TaxID=627669 RepID=A0A6J5FAR4_9BURK|nr:hypothetical protein LMG29542_07701 [Paraburkholderia humisilvae]